LDHSRARHSGLLITPKGAPTMKKWLLQSNPAKFDFNHPTFLSYWSFMDQAHAEMLSPGDIVVIWASGPNSGIRAVAKVADAEPYQTTSEPGSGWAPEFIGQRKWVRRLEAQHVLERPVPRAILKDDPRFAGSLILRMPGGANPFPVSDSEWSALCEAILVESLDATPDSTV
jgi:EVE domain